MFHRTCTLLLLSVLASLSRTQVWAAPPLHERIDALIEAKGKGKPISPQADDAEFLRRVFLDLTGTIPSATRARAFLADKSPGKRTKLIDELLASPEHPRRMQELFHVHFMERLGDHPEWTNYLLRSFAANKPFDQMAREILRADPKDEAARGASFFLAKRLENYGTNPVDHAALARDIGRLFLGQDLRCAQCHDHLFIKDYKQADFQGLFAFVQHTYLQDAATLTVAEKALDKKLTFVSVFDQEKQETGPRLPKGKELTIPMFKKGEEYISKPDPRKKIPGIPRFSPLTELSRTLPSADNPDFSRNIVNRVWFFLMGRGLVHPLDLHHSDNPPSHPELLDLLAREFVAHQDDLRWLLRELARTRTYQRSSLLPEGTDKSDPALFLTMAEKRLQAEQLLAAVLEATGEKERLVAADKVSAEKPAKGKATLSPLAAARAKFIKAFANAPRDPEEEFSPSLKSALFLLNDPTVLDWLSPRPGNLLDRTSKLTDTDKLAEELYLSILTRLPSAEEKAEVARHLKKDKPRPVLIFDLAWALLASTEFAVNH